MLQLKDMETLIKFANSSITFHVRRYDAEQWLIGIDNGDINAYEVLCTNNGQIRKFKTWSSAVKLIESSGGENVIICFKYGE